MTQRLRPGYTHSQLGLSTVREIGTGIWSVFLRQARKFLFFSMMSEEASIQVSRQGTEFEPLGLGPSSSVKKKNRLLVSLGRKGKNRNSLACLRNAGSYSAVTYCIRQETSRRSDPRQTTGRQNRLCTISIRVEKNLWQNLRSKKRLLGKGRSGEQRNNTRSSCKASRKPWKRSLVQGSGK